MSVTVIKTSKRTMRSTCERCKVNGDYYWGQIEETGVRVLLDQSSLNEGIEYTGKAVPSSTVHSCFRKQAGLDGAASTPSVPVSDPEPIITGNPWQVGPEPVAADPDPFNDPDRWSPEPEPTFSPVPPSTGTPVAPDSGQTAQMAKLFEMMAELFGSQIDMDELLGKVQAMVNAEVDRVAHPVQTVVINADNGNSHSFAGDTHAQLADVIGALEDGHVYLIGPAGTGKSRIAEDAAEARGQKFFGLNLTQQTPVSALAGYMSPDGVYIRPGSGFRDAVEFGHLFLADEVDHGHANTVAFMNGATSNRLVGFPDGMVEVHENFRLAGAANTFGKGQNALHTGATKLDAATLNRFGVLEIAYDEALEAAMVSGTGLDSASQRKVLEFVRKVRDNAIRHPEFQVVASPRNSVRIAKAMARGVIWDRAVEIHLLAGISDDKRAKLTA